MLLLNYQVVYYILDVCMARFLKSATMAVDNKKSLQFSKQHGGNFYSSRGDNTPNLVLAKR
jgi:hypothetical protein